ncbi:UDP-Glycosyltransferase/glycogen phosphorylase [Lichtheimia hyalospora FSU 10163]|nr:UDP-Glycosyltransferase/glycogen phosphorylase [Lichtheimia hyalospora FSU 10163]
MSTLLSALLIVLWTIFHSSHYVGVHGAEKHIHLCTTLGGISHSRWLFEISNVLMARGYHVTYITDEYNVRFTSGYPNLDVQPILPPTTTIYPNNSMFTSLDELLMWKTLRKVLESGYDTNYDTMMAFFEKHSPDVVVCDMILDFCIDAANEYGAPVAITSTSTLMHRQQSVCQIPFLQWMCRYIMRLWYPFLWRDHKTHALKLVNNYFGLEPAQDFDPLTHMVGPILPDLQDAFNLSSAEEQFLATHEKVVLAAFGQHQLFHLDSQEIASLDIALQEHGRCSNVDGVIWVTRGKDNICNNQRASILDYLCVEWIDQHTILHHPAVRLFISHGGSGSLHESLDACTPLLLFPSMADQIPNAKQLEAEGVARWHPRGGEVNVQRIIEDIEFLLRPNNAPLRESLNRHKILVNLGKRRKYYAADLLEELVLTSNVHGHLVHRIKKTNMNLVDMLSNALK